MSFNSTCDHHHTHPTFNLQDVDDVDTAAPTDGSVLVWNAANAVWTNGVNYQTLIDALEVRIAALEVFHP